ncbi:MAG: DUF2304 domain-containing protein [Planctomycetes bacterium]|nr:DUF2304 domain-containing protein [Planctomycetota bacterium]
MNALASIGGLEPFQILTIGLGLVIFLLTFEMIRRDLLRTAYALLWLISGLAVALIGLFPDTVNLLQKYTGMTYQTGMLFCVFGFVLLLMMQYSIIISRLSARNKLLTQDLAILREQVRRLNERVNPESAAKPDTGDEADGDSADTK